MGIILKDNYTAPIDSIVSSVIREYDLKEAGFNIIINEGLLSEKYINKLKEKTKDERTILIGKLMRKSKELNRSLTQSFGKVRKEFIELNDISEDKILSIKKDAIFVLNDRAEKEKFRGYNFRMKNKYSSFFKLSEKEFYYSSWKRSIDIKGINDKVKEDHKDYLIERIMRIMKLNETNSKENMIKILRMFRSEYLNRELDIEYYREFNSRNMFKYNFKLGKDGVYSENVDNFMKEELDITYNYFNIIIPLISIII
jgi:hypothetical protein